MSQFVLLDRLTARVVPKILVWVGISLNMMKIEVWSGVMSLICNKTTQTMGLNVQQTTQTAPKPDDDVEINYYYFSANDSQERVNDPTGSDGDTDASSARANHLS